MFQFQKMLLTLVFAMKLTSWATELYSFSSSLWCSRGGPTRSVVLPEVEVPFAFLFCLYSFHAVGDLHTVIGLERHHCHCFLYEVTVKEENHNLP